MIGILEEWALKLGLIFAINLQFYRGKIDQDYPLFLLYNKSNIPGRPESIELHQKFVNKIKNFKNKKKYISIKSLINGCKVLKKSKCKYSYSM